ncbi:MAG: glycosyltransferase [Gallionella sp.]|jgi:hypothetical protein
MTLAPIALFVYNRPAHTRQTVEALLKNELAGESDLIIYSDAQKKPEAAEAVREVREYIRTITGFRSVSIVEREKNLGLANSIIDGVTSVVNERGRIIVLEDDLVTSPYFLRFMNDALDMYEREESVISIHGYVYPVAEKLPETFFLRGADCWGWATWKRGWELFEPDGEKLLASLKIEHLETEFNFGGSYDYLGMLDSQVKGENDSWAIRWYASAFLKNKLTLYPGRSLVLNIGNDNSGTHCGATEIFSGDIIARPVAVGGIPIVARLEARSAVAKYFATDKDSLLRQAMQRIGNFGKRWLRWGG